jgi:3-hydroxyacyl-CoA dehydrogenase
MGAGMAAVFARAGCEVRLTARRETSLADARRRAESIVGESASRISTTTSTEDAFAGADLVVETIAEEVEPKQRLLEVAERVTGARTILVTNTSSLSLAALAARLERPERFAGLHWFNPPELVELVEVVGTERTEPVVLETLRGWMELLGKAPVVLARDTPGFIANRLQYALVREAYALVDAGICTPEDVDRVLTHGLGARWAAVGPFQALDLAGLDVHVAVATELFPKLTNAVAPPAQAVRLVGEGALGCKTGRGLLGDYDQPKIRALASRRVRVLLGLPALRDGKEE